MAAVTTFATTGNAHIDGLLGGVKWAEGILDPTTGLVFTSLTFSFPASASYYGSGYGDGEPLDNFGSLNTAQQTATHTILGMYESVANLTFVEIEETSTQHADLRLAASDAPPTAWAYFPHPSPEGGDVWFNKSTGWYDNPIKGEYGYLTFIHEIGHALGLKHPHEAEVGVQGTFGAMPLAQDSLEYTVMSYRSYVGASTTSGYVNGDWDYPQSLMMHDIRAIQQLYGANYATNSGNTTYSWNPTTGEMTVDGVAQGAPGGNRIFLTVWDGGGSDTYDFSNYTTNLKVDLQPGAWTTTATAQLARLNYYETNTRLAAGNIANALLYNNDLRSLIENANGGSGADTITGNIVANRLAGAAGADRLYGLDGNDSLIGGNGNDYLSGDAGTDTVSYFGLSSDYWWRKNADLTWTIIDLRAGSADGTDTLNAVEVLQFDNQSITLDVAAAVGITVTGTIGNNVLSAGNGNDLLQGLAGNDSLNGGAGADRFDGGAGTDAVTYAGSDAGVTVNLALTTAQVSAGHASGDVLAAIENLIGSAYDDRLTGNALNNLLEGGAGADRIDGGLGIDTASYQSSTAGVRVSLFTNAGLGGDAEGDILDGIENLTGSSYNDTFEGSAAANTLNGGAGADTVSYANSTAAVTVNLALTTAQVGGHAAADILAGIENVTGSAFNDTLTGNASANILEGGAGDDTYNVAAGDVVVEEAAGGTDRVFSSVTYGLSAHVENLTLTGTAAINGTGNDLANTITGNGAANVLEGGAGADYLNGGAGADTASYANSAASVSVSLLTSTGSGGHAEGDTLLGIENLTGSAHEDVLEGSAAANRLNGGLGTDTVTYANSTAAVTVNLALTTAQRSYGHAASDILTGIENVVGSAFNDTLTGNASANVLAGGTGNDTYNVAAGDVVVEEDGAGTDRVFSSVTYSLSAYVENLTLTGSAAINGIGNDLANVITGNGAASVLEGGAGADRLNGGSGTDTASYAGSDLGVTVNLALTTGQTGGHASDDILTSIENLIGSAFNDTLTGNSASNVLEGGAGADHLNGGAGADTASYQSSTAGVSVSLFTNTGLGGDAAGDTLLAIENLTGSSHNDVLEGSAAANRLNGGAGTDTVSYANSTAAVTVNLALTTAQAGGHAAGDILTGIENVTGSAFNDTLTGNASANVLKGGAGNDRLSGAAGADILEGELGNDILTGGLDNDVFVFRADFGQDTITDFAASGDVVEFHSLFADFDDMRLNAVETTRLVGTTSVTDVVITYDADPVSESNPVDKLTLQNASLAGLTDADFLFA